MSLPSFNTSDRILSQMQSAWATQLDPIVDNPLVQGRLITGVVVVTGSNVINHKLGRKLQGYIVVLNNASATFYDTQSTNTMPDKTLNLVASAAATISLWCF